MTGIPVANCPQKSNGMTRSRRHYLCSAPPEKSVQLQGWGQRGPLWDLGRVQSICLCLCLCLSAGLCLPLAVCLQEFTRDCRSSLNCCCWALLKFLLHLHIWHHATLVLSELILIYLCLLIPPAISARQRLLCWWKKTARSHWRCLLASFWNRKSKVICHVLYSIWGM